ncbi:MAG: hypothetical protein SFW09_00745 [Hyphomicrobiaceae bacterium]|nr:hypothetical protein [Hyphomicrobiaceae bacterium]
MSTTIMEAQLKDALDRDRDLAARGCYAAITPPSGVVVERRGRMLATWHWRSGGFELHRPGTSDPVVKVETVAEALHRTREHVCPQT